MEKIVIIGSSGAGKSTFARALGSALNMKVHHLDRLFWQCDWKGRTEHARKRILKNQTVHGEEQWIIEGNYLRFSQIHVHAADTIIFLDIPSIVCCWHLLQRHREYYKCSRYDIPKGCTDRLALKRIVKVLTFRFHGRSAIERTLRNYAYKRIITLHSTQEMDDFLKRQKPILGDINSSSMRMERILAITQ